MKPISTGKTYSKGRKMKKDGEGESELHVRGR